MNVIKQLSSFKNPVNWVIRKSKKIIVLIFSKEVLVAFFIFLESMYLKPTVDCRSFTSYEVYQFCLIKSESSGFLTSSSRIQDYILKSRGGSEELSSEVRSTDILGPYEPDKQAKIRSRSSSSIFIEGFSTSTTLSKRVQRNRALILSKKEPTLTPTMLKANQVPTSDLFSADSVTRDIQNINIAFNQFE